MATNHIKVIPPNKLDTYYISYKNKGISTFSPRDTRTGYVLPNCTAFAEGWFNKELNKIRNDKDKIVYSFNGNACDYFNDAKQRLKLNTGNKPEEGAMMCWSGGKGHVAIVDKVYEDGSIDISESNYGDTIDYKHFHMTNKNGRWGMSSAYTFLGFVYNPAIKQIELPKPVARDKMTDQVYISNVSLRCRVKPSLQGDIIGIVPIGYYNYTDTEVADGYIWYKVGETHWLAGVKGTLTDFPCVKVGDIVTIDPNTPVRVAYRSYAYTTKWKVEKIFTNGRAVIKNLKTGATINVARANLIK